jgi:hypothetical protein
LGHEWDKISGRSKLPLPFTQTERLKRLGAPVDDADLEDCPLAEGN